MRNRPTKNRWPKVDGPPSISVGEVVKGAPRLVLQCPGCGADLLLMRGMGLRAYLTINRFGIQTEVQCGECQAICRIAMDEALVALETGKGSERVRVENE
jgi:hypothetical protein